MRFFAKALVFLLLLLPAATPVLAYDPLCPGGWQDGTCQSGPCASTTTNNPNAACKQDMNNQSPTAGNPANSVVKSAANIVAMAAGFAAVVIIIISGITFATSGGDQEKIKKARTTMTSAIIGLVIVALAWVIVTFIVQKLVT